MSRNSVQAFYILTITDVLMCEIVFVAVVFNTKGIGVILSWSHIRSDYVHVDYGILCLLLCHPFLVLAYRLKHLKERVYYEFLPELLFALCLIFWWQKAGILTSYFCMTPLS
jgi:hypothetical protein